MPSSGKTLVAVTRVRRSARLLEQGGERLVARPRAEVVDVDAGRHLVDAVDVPDDVVEHVADVLGADEDGIAPRERLPPPADELVVPRIEYSSSEPCALTLNARTASPRRPDRRAGRGSRTRGRPAGAREARAAFASTYASRSSREVLEQPRLEPLVAVEHEDRQQPVRQLGPTTVAPPRSYRSGCRSWQTTTTSCPAGVHSRASARV